MPAIEVFQCDEDGWLMGLVLADESPLEPGIFHIPAGAYEKQPPQPEDGKHPRMLDGEWVLCALPVTELEPEQPGPESELQYPRFIGNQKLDLFTKAEQLTVVAATMTDPMVKLMYDRLLGAAFLTYEDPEVEAGFSLLLDKGLLTLERKAAIVAQMQPQ